MRGVSWKPAEDAKLLDAIARRRAAGGALWAVVVSQMPGRTRKECTKRADDLGVTPRQRQRTRRRDSSDLPICEDSAIVARAFAGLSFA